MGDIDPAGLRLGRIRSLPRARRLHVSGARRSPILLPQNKEEVADFTVFGLVFRLIPRVCVCVSHSVYVCVRVCARA